MRLTLEFTGLRGFLRRSGGMMGSAATTNKEIDMEQLTTEQAIAFHDSGAWEKMTSQERAVFQMAQDKLCMPFGEFHKAVEEALGRPVWTHEFGLNRDGIRAELEGKATASRSTKSRCVSCDA